MARVALEKQRIDKLIDIPELKQYDMEVFTSIGSMRGTISEAIHRYASQYEGCHPAGFVVLLYCKCGNDTNVRFLGFKHEINDRMSTFGWQGVMYVTVEEQHESRVSDWINQKITKLLEKSIAWQTNLLQKLSK